MYIFSIISTELQCIFHFSNMFDTCFNRLREAEVEQEEAEAEVTHEKNRRLQEFKSEVEVKSAELEHIKSEVMEISEILSECY